MLHSTAIMGLLSRWELHKIIVAILVQALQCFYFLKTVANSLRKTLYSTLFSVYAKEEGREQKK